MNYQAVLFDLDGTLLDTLEDLADSMNAVLSDRGWPTHPAEAYKYFVGDGVTNLALRVMPQENRSDESLPDILVAEMSEQYANRWDAKTRPYDGIADMLNGLSALGLAMAVLSNKPNDFTLLCVEKLLAGWKFDVIRGVGDGVMPKPDPAGALKVAEEMGLRPEEFLYLGDTNTDMQTAVAAGMYPVGALWGFRQAEELTANGAKTLINHPTDLLKLI
ncbi:MAG: HAD family hydrolase [Phycisphaerae bacterium]|nr:HAD family hydrolase [Phycisphaerae bacterium]